MAVCTFFGHRSVSHETLIPLTKVLTDLIENKGVDTFYPSALDNVPYRARIVARNEWMIKNSDYVVTYVEQNIGGAAESKSKAEKLCKKIINISTPTPLNPKKPPNWAVFV